MPRSVEIFEAVHEEVVRKFVYATDKQQYGVMEKWQDLREVKGGRLAGDCEDFCITIVNRAVSAGANIDDFTLYLVQIEEHPDHIVLGCFDEDTDRIWIADCNSTELLDREGSSRFYFDWVSERELSGGEWVRS